MKVILYMATSIDGYIATPNGDSEWISEIDIEMFDRQCESSDCIIIGNTTYNQYKGEIYPIPGKTNIVVTTSHTENTDVSYASSPKEALELATKKGCVDIMLVGGGHINGSFLKEGLIDEIIIDIQPLILGTGIKLFEDITNILEVTHKSTQQLAGGLTVITYTVKK